MEIVINTTKYGHRLLKPMTISCLIVSFFG
nr:MAG TPA: hypothetical protein [Caudoviricetes sp.]